MDAPRLSIIVPVYNTGKYLSACIDSILSQSFEDFELLLIDDGSTDTSYSICRFYSQKDSRVRNFHQKNQGPSAARNLGMDNASGEYWMFVDSDDELAPGTLEQNMQYLLTHPEVTLLQFPMEARFSDGKIEKRYSNRMLIEGINEINTVWCRSSDLINGFFGGKIYHSILLRNIHAPIDMKFDEDAYFLCDVLPKCQCIYLSDYGSYIYKIRNDSLTSAKDQTEINIHALNELRVLYKKLQNANALNLSKKINVELYGYILTVLLGHVIHEKVPVTFFKDLLGGIEKEQPSYYEIFFSDANMKTMVKCIMAKMFGLKRLVAILKKSHMLYK